MELLAIEKDGKFVFSSHKHSREEILKEKAKYYWELIRGGYKQKFKVGDRVILDQYPCVVNKVEWRGDSKYVGYVYTVIGTDFGRKVKEADLMPDASKEKTKSHNNMCKQLIDEMNPNVEVNVKRNEQYKKVEMGKAYSWFLQHMLEFIEIENINVGHQITINNEKMWEKFKKAMEE